MKETLQRSLETLIANEKLVEQAGRMEFSYLVKLGGLLYLNAGSTPDPQRIKDMRRVLKERAGLFSNWRGHLEFIVRIKMSLAEDAGGYLDDVMHIYEVLRTGITLPGEMVAMTAMTIKDVCPAERVDEVAVQTRDAWIKTRKLHPLLTGEDDMALMALMCTAGMDADAAAERAEAIFGHMVDKGIPKSAAQSCAMVLSLYDRPVDEMVAKMCDLYQALKEAKHATSRLRDESMAIYAAFTDIEAPTETLVTEIGEVDTWLRRQRGYGPMGVGGNVRRLIAAAMVLRDYETENATSASIAINAASAVTQAIIEQVVLTVMLLILVSVISSTTSSSH